MLIMILVLVTGMPGAGKSLIAEAAKRLNIPVICMGDIVREKAKERGLPITPEVLNKIATELREKYGADVIAKLTLEKVSKLNQKVVLIDGVRSWSEVQYFKNKCKDIVIVAIHAPPQERFKRLLSRGRKDDPKTFEEFVKRDERELKMGIGNVIALADYMIVNFRKKKEEIIQEAIEVLKEVIKSGSRS